MNLKDIHDQALSGANATAVERFDQACALLRCYLVDPLAEANAALEAAPEMTMAHVLVGYLNLLGTEPAGFAPAQAALARAAALPATERERQHVAALQALTQRRWHRASRILEDLSVQYPRDLLALQVGHSVDFFTGHSRMLRDRIARAASHWHQGMPGYHAILSMLAFGFEETGDYATAETHGRRSVELEPRDGWGWHAVAHVMEMQGRRAEGVAWLRQDTQAWSEGSFFAGHNWWHLALFHLGLDQLDEVMQLVDSRLIEPASPVVLDMVDASAMLWRLQLRGVALGDRWQALAQRWKSVSEESTYAFNDMHAMMAFTGAGRGADAAELLQAQKAALRTADDNVMFLREVGIAGTRAIFDFADGRYAEAATQLRDIRTVAARFGGSHAQRDLIDLTLIEAADRAGNKPLADALRRERAMVRH